MADLNAIFGIQSAQEKQTALADADFTDGFSVASVACIDLGSKIREAYPDQSAAFYRGLISGIREELC